MPVLIFLLTSTSFAKKKKSSDQTQAPTEAVDPVAQANIPTDDNSKEFAKTILSTTFENFDANIMGLVWHQLTFSSDNTFSATASQTIMDEASNCSEKGTWTMDPASSPTLTNMTLTIESGDCPVADVPRTMRIQATLNGNRIDAKYR